RITSAAAACAYPCLQGGYPTHSDPSTVWRQTMSHTATITYGSLERIAPERQIAQPKPIGLLPTIAWSTLAMVAIFWVPLAGMAVQALWNPAFRMPTLLSFYLPSGHIAACLVVAAAVWFSGRSFREYLTFKSLRTRDVFAGIGFGVLAFFMMLAIFVV